MMFIMMYAWFSHRMWPWGAIGLARGLHLLNNNCVIHQIRCPKLWRQECGSTLRKVRGNMKLERQADGEVEGVVAAEAGIGDGVVRVVSGVDGFHAEVEAQDEVVEVEAQAQTVGHGYLADEL